MFVPKRPGGALLAPVLIVLCTAVPAQAHPRIPADARIVELTNQARAAAGCGPLVPDPRLMGTAGDHAGDMAVHDYFAHSRPLSRLLHLLPGAGRVGENIAAGRGAADGTFQQWMNSPGHRANIEDCAYTSIGVGHGYSPHSRYGHYWVQQFAGP